MEKILRLFFISLIFFNGGCTWTALASSSFNPKEYGCSRKLDEEIRKEELKLDQELVGQAKEDVIAMLGKPKAKNIKHELSYLVDRNCFGRDCETKLSDEAWYYDFEKTIPSCGQYAYSIIVYFVGGKVVKVG